MGAAQRIISDRGYPITGVVWFTEGDRIQRGETGREVGRVSTRADYGGREKTHLYKRPTPSRAFFSPHIDMLSLLYLNLYVDFRFNFSMLA